MLFLQVDSLHPPQIHFLLPFRDSDQVDQAMGRKKHMSYPPSENELCKAIKGKYVEDMSQTQLHQQTYVQDIVPGKLHRNEYVNQTVSKQQLNKTHIRAGYGS